MMSLWQAPAVVVVFVTWLASPPADLADAARREAMRRHLTRPAATMLTNMGERLQPIEAGAANTGASATTADDGAAAVKAAADKSGANAQADAKKPANDEKAWRDRITQARQQLERDETHADAMQSRINSLKTDAIMRDDPAQQAKMRDEYFKAVNELERLKKDIENGKKMIVDIQTDARKQGVPPGWVR